MNKMLKRIFVLVIAVTLFVMPASTVLAASQPILVTDTGTYKYFEYRPDPLLLIPGEGAMLPNNILDGQFAIPSGKALNFISNFSSGICTYRITRILPQVSVVAEGITWNGSIYVQVPAYDQPATYIIQIINSTSGNVSLYNYTVFY